MRKLLCSLVALTFSYLLFAQASESAHSFFYRPDIHGNEIVFTAEGDLWLCNLKTNEVRRLTSDPGLETNAKFSPDGTQIAFDAAYAGKIDVFVMPTEGGIPKRVTYDPGTPTVQCWTPNGKSILFVSGRLVTNRLPELFTVPATGGPATKLYVPQAFFASYSPDGSRLAYVPDSNEWMNWFRYQAGEADSIWLTTLKHPTFEKLTDTKWVDTQPVWVGDKIYFVSERTGIRNLWELNPDTKAVKQLTFSTTVPVRYPSTDGHRVIYQIGDSLGIYDPQNSKAEVLNLQLHSDRLHARSYDVPIAPTIESGAIGPTGKRVAIISRGQLVTIPAKDGEMHVLEHDSAQRSRNAAWSADGKTIAFVSDKSGEEQLYLVGTMPGSKPKQLTTELIGEHFRPIWSANGKYLVIGDRGMNIQLVNVKNGEVTLIDRADRGGSYDSSNQDYTFSPDDKWVAYSKEGPGWINSVWLYNITSGTKTEISDPEINSSSPSFDPDDKFLYMVQQRSTSAEMSPYNSMLAFEKPNTITAVALAKNTVSPFAPKDEEEGAPIPAPISPENPTPTPPKKPVPTPNPPKPSSASSDDQAGQNQRTTSDKSEDSAKVPKNAETKIDLDGIQNRVFDMKLPASNYGQVIAINGKLVVTDSTDSTLSVPGDTSVETFDIKTKALTPIAGGLQPLGNADDPQVIQTSSDGDHVLVHVGTGYQILETETPNAPGKGMLPVSGLILNIDPVKEWKEIFEEGWRIARDFYIDPNMGGVNWAAVKTKYEAMLPRVGDRTDLDHVLGDMLAELSTGHCYVGGPNPYGKAPENMGFLGANIEYNPVAKAFQIKRILKTSAWNIQEESPLVGLGLDVKVGDYILAVDGEPVTGDYDFEKNLVGAAGKVIALTISTDPTGNGSRIIRVVPLPSEAGLRYLDWVESRKEYVAKASGGQIAYVHMSDMEGNGASEFAQMYYAEVEKPGIIMDVRFNGGGAISYNTLLPLSTKTLGFFKPRYGVNWRREGWAPLGHVVGLTNEWAFSDGEMFSEDFKRLKIGPLVGHRTGGGEIGSGAGYPLVDGGTIYVPNYGAWAVDGKWVIEGSGAVPDVPVDQDPMMLMEGKDPQLDAAIKIIMDDLKAHPFSIPQPPPFPNHTKGSRSEGAAVD